MSEKKPEYYYYEAKVGIPSDTIARIFNAYGPGVGLNTEVTPDMFPNPISCRIERLIEASSVPEVRQYVHRELTIRKATQEDMLRAIHGHINLEPIAQPTNIDDKTTADTVDTVREGVPA